MLRRVAKAGSGGGVSGSRSPFSGPVERLMRGFGLDCQGGVGEAEGGEGGRGRGGRERAGPHPYAWA